MVLTQGFYVFSYAPKWRLDTNQYKKIFSQMNDINFQRQIFIDPPSKIFYKDQLFNKNNLVLNRDEALEPFIRLKNEENNSIKTADYLIDIKNADVEREYYSLGILGNYKKLLNYKNIKFKSFIIFEPPIVDPNIYEKLPELTKIFDAVYVHNTVGDGYSLKGVNVSKLKNLHWPQPRKGIVEEAWENNNRSNHIVVINGNHKPRLKKGELYSQRIEAMVTLEKKGKVVLYGRGWKKWWSRSSMWMPYWRNYSTLMSIYKGPCESKINTLSKYQFCLCFENMEMFGYITEKIFDCFYAGTIPIYLGAPDIDKHIPSEAFIDCRKFDSWNALQENISNMKNDQIIAMKNAGRNFIESKEYKKYFNSLLSIFEIEMIQQ
jgi:hypothetical protein